MHAFVRPRECPCNQTICGTTGTCGAAPERSRQRAAGRQAPAAAPLPSAQELDCSPQARECVAATTAATAGPACEVKWRSGHCRRLLQLRPPLPPAMRPAQWQAGRLGSEAASGCKGREAGVLVKTGCLCAYCRTVAVEAAVVPTHDGLRPGPHLCAKKHTLRLHSRPSLHSCVWYLQGMSETRYAALLSSSLGVVQNSPSAQRCHKHHSTAQPVHLLGCSQYSSTVCAKGQSLPSSQRCSCTCKKDGC